MVCCSRLFRLREAGHACIARAHRVAGLQDKFGEILVPAEEVVEMRAGKKRRSERKFFPGYVLVEMDLDDVAGTWSKKRPRCLGLSAVKQINPLRSPMLKRRRSFSAFKQVVNRRHQRQYSSPASWSELSTGHSTTSMALSKKLTTKRTACMLR